MPVVPSPGVSHMRGRGNLNIMPPRTMTARRTTKTLRECTYIQRYHRPATASD